MSLAQTAAELDVFVGYGCTYFDVDYYNTCMDGFTKTEAVEWALARWDVPADMQPRMLRDAMDLLLEPLVRKFVGPWVASGPKIEIQPPSPRT